MKILDFNTKEPIVKIKIYQELLKEYNIQETNNENCELFIELCKIKGNQHKTIQEIFEGLHWII